MDLIIDISKETLWKNRNVRGFLYMPYSFLSSDLPPFLPTPTPTSSRLPLRSPHGHFGWQMSPVCQSAYVLRTE